MVAEKEREREDQYDAGRLC